MNMWHPHVSSIMPWIESWRVNMDLGEALGPRGWRRCWHSFMQGPYIFPFQKASVKALKSPSHLEKFPERAFHCNSNTPFCSSPQLSMKSQFTPKRSFPSLFSLLLDCVPSQPCWPSWHISSRNSWGSLQKLWVFAKGEASGRWQGKSWKAA